MTIGRRKFIQKLIIMLILLFILCIHYYCTHCICERVCVHHIRYAKRKLYEHLIIKININVPQFNKINNNDS